MPQELPLAKVSYASIEWSSMALLDSCQTGSLTSALGEYHRSLKHMHYTEKTKIAAEEKAA